VGVSSTQDNIPSKSRISDLCNDILVRLDPQSSAQEKHFLPRDFHTEFADSTAKCSEEMKEKVQKQAQMHYLRDEGYKSNDESVLRGVVLVLVLIRETDPGTVISLPGFRRHREQQGAATQAGHVRSNEKRKNKDFRDFGDRHIPLLLLYLTW
jgi:hypothetical protein